MWKHSTIWLLALTLALALGAGTVLYAQTTNVERDFTFTGDNYVYNVAGLSIGTSATTSGSIHFSDGTTMSSVNDAGSWTSTSTGILYNSGNVGINVSNPNSKLDVNGNIYGGVLYDKDNTNWLVNPSGQSYFSGDVGIGTTTPSKVLHIQKDSADFVIDQSNGDRSVFLGSPSQGRGVLSLYDDSGSNTVSLYGDANNSFINNGQNFGIGTTTPSGILEVTQSGSSAHFILNRNTGGTDAELFFAAEDNETLIRARGRGGSGTRTLALNDNGGNVGIGVYQPDSQLEVAGSVRADQLTDRNNTNWLVNPSGESYLSGNVGIGTTTPSSALDVDGNIEADNHWGTPSDITTTTATHDGSFGGYKAMNDWIQDNGCSGYRVCSGIDIIRYVQLNGAEGHRGWYTGGTVSEDGGDYIKDCGGWSKNDGYRKGRFWRGDIPDPYYDSCDTKREVMCCKF